MRLIQPLPPLVSILLPTYSRYKSGHLQRAVDSVLEQDFTNFELWLVDDASIDGTCEYIKQLVKTDSRVKHLRLSQNIGLPSQTLAKAFLLSQGEFIAFNFDDTVLSRNCLSTLLQPFELSPDLEMVYGGMRMHMPDGVVQYGSPPELVNLKRQNFIGNSSVMLRRSAFDRVGWYDPNIILKRSCDWDLWLRAFKCLKVKYLKDVLSDEYGQSLGDSFRRSHYLFEKLVHRYMNFERTPGLLPSDVAKSDFPVDVMPFSLTEEEEEQYSQACLEHFVRTLNFTKVAQLTTKMAFKRNSTITELTQRMGITDPLELSESTASLIGSIAYYSSKLKESQAEIYLHESSLFDTRQELGLLKDEYHQVLRSFSWQVTKPLRTIKSRYSPIREE